MKVAIVQQPAIVNDLNASLDLAEHIIKEAKTQSADLVVFGENWLCGYPAWIDYCSNVSLWDDPIVKRIYSEIFQSSIVLDTPEFLRLQKMIKASNILVVIGANEAIHYGPGNGSIYNASFIFSEKGEVLNHHRKLVPTYTEKLVHTHGDGHGLKSVETKFGRIGTLICWEHWMPLTRQAMHDEAEDLHIALWPTVKEMNVVASRQYAFEGRCHVISAGTVMPMSSTPKGLIPNEQAKDNKYAMRGGSCIIAPTGEILMNNQYDKSEIIYYDLPDLKTNIGERMNLAVSGNYQRHDVFNLKIDKSRRF